MIFLFFAILASIGIAVIFKVAGDRNADRLTLIAVGYVVAAAVGLSVQSVQGDLTYLADDQGLLVFGIVVGASFVIGFTVFAWAIKLIGMAIVTGVARTSVVLPFLASWLVWSEVPSIPQLMGVTLAIVAFALLAKTISRADKDARKGPMFKLIVLIGVFVLVGMADLAMKTFEVWYSGNFDASAFTLLVFGAAACFGMLALVFRGVSNGHWPDRRSILWSILLGVINYPSIDLLVRAAEVLPGTVAFPVNGIGATLGAALLGILVFKERLSRVNFLGLAFAGIALVLLNV